MDRSQERPPNTKAFVIKSEKMLGASNKERFEADADYMEIKDLQMKCMQHAFAYSSTMVNRILTERPEALEEKGMTKAELITYLTSNMCQDINKAHSRALRDHLIREKD